MSVKANKQTNKSILKQLNPEKYYLFSCTSWDTWCKLTALEESGILEQFGIRFNGSLEAILRGFFFLIETCEETLISYSGLKREREAETETEVDYISPSN